MNLQIAMSRREPARRKRLNSHIVSGFTLLELLVVIAIMLVVLGIAGTVFRSTGGRPSQAMEMVAAMVSVAREDALATGAPTRVAICVDTAAGAKYLRYVTALVDSDGDPATVNWKISGPGRTLPQGTIFWPDYSTPAGATNTMKLNLATPGVVQDGASGSTCVFIEFNAFGTPTQSGLQWVFTKAVMDDSGGAPVIPKPMDRDGFILRQTGRIASFRSPVDISKPQ